LRVQNQTSRGSVARASACSLGENFLELSGRIANKDGGIFPEPWSSF
jgi:hypothetical protein